MTPFPAFHVGPPPSPRRRDRRSDLKAPKARPRSARGAQRRVQWLLIARERGVGLGLPEVLPKLPKREENLNFGPF